MDSATLHSTLPTEQRLALAYAPRAARDLWAGLFLLDSRLADILRGAREPMLGQIRLAWWRDRLTETGHPLAGEPLLALLSSWGEHGRGLVALVDGWEALLDEGPVGAEALSGFAEGRAQACVALARAAGVPEAADEAARAGFGWAIADLGGKLTRKEERNAANGLAGQQDWRRSALPRPLRPLMVLHGLARRNGGAKGLLSGPGDLLIAARIGLIGR